MDLSNIKNLNKLHLELNGLTDARELKIRKDRACYACKKHLTSGTKCITATHKVDKRHKVTFKWLYDRGKLQNKHKFTPEQHWMCLSCAEKALKKTEIETYRSHMIEHSDINWFEELDKILDEYNEGIADASELIEVAENAYKFGALSLKELNNLKKEVQS